MQVTNDPVKIIKKYQETRIDLITNHKDIAWSQAGTEAESSKDYAGRVAFEFFQNAVDRADRHIWMKLTKDSFIISNDGQAFTIFEEEINNRKSDFHSMNTIHNGDKIAGESIGNKGVGFKSCWNVSEHVQIESMQDSIPWGFELFNPVKIENFENEDIKKAIQVAGGRVPSFYFPKYLESKVENFKSNAVTVITINFNREDAYDEIKKELEEFKQTKFIFLNLLKGKSNKEYEIHISIDDDEESFNSNDKDWGVVVLKGKEIFKEEFEALKTRREKENYENIPDEPNIAIAFPPDNIDIEGNSKFYTYLPTKVKCGFNVLIHADFALDNARKHIPDNQYNDKILEIAAKMLVNEFLNNEELHIYNSFAKFLIPMDKDDRFAKFVWKELIKDDILSDILKKVFSFDRNFPKESYEAIFYAISKWQKEKTRRNWGTHYEEIYSNTLKYFCNPEIFIVWIDENNKTFLPPKKSDNAYEFNLFYRESKEAHKLDLSLLSEFEKIKISTFETLGDGVFTHNKIVRKFSTVEILRSLKQYKSSNIIKFVKQLIDTPKEDLSDTVKEQLLEMNIPIGDDEFIEVKKCYINIDTMIQDIFNDEYKEMDLSELNEDIDGEFLTKIGVADNRFPFYAESKKIVLPFKEGVDFPKNNDLKDLMLKSLSYFDKKIIIELGKIAWFYDERKKELFCPNEVFLFKEHDNRKIECVSQAKKESKYRSLYDAFNILEIDDTGSLEKLLMQLEKMKEFNIDSYHQDIYKKLTYQLAKIYDKKDELNIPIMAMSIQEREVAYVNRNANIIFLETKHKRYKDELKESYDYLGYFDTNISHIFLQRNIGIKVFNPNYKIEYKELEKTVEPIIDNNLKQMLKNEFLAPFFAIANEVLGSKFEKDDAIKRWENLTIKKAKNVILTMTEERQKTITVGSTEQSDIDVLYIPIKDRHNKPTLIGEVAHDLHVPEQNSNLRKFAQVFAEGIFRSQKLKSDFELYITAYLKKDETLQKDILDNKGVEDSHIEEMISFIESKLLTKDEKNEILKKLNEVGVSISDYSQVRDFHKYEDLESTFEEFGLKFDNKFKIVIDSLIVEYKQYIKAKILKQIENNKQELQVLCFKKANSRSEFNQILERVKEKKIVTFKNKMNPFERFEVIQIDKNSDAYIESLLDFMNYTDEIQNIKFDFTMQKNSLESENKPHTGKASKSDKEINLEKEKKNQKVGLGQELKIAYKWARKINNKKQFIERIKTDIYEDDKGLHDDENLKRYIEELDKYKNSDNLKFAENVIQIAHHNLDGLGYDLVIPKFDKNNREVVGIRKVELKSTTRPNNIEIHFSRNEIKRILHYMEVANWEIWLNDDTDNEEFRSLVRNAVKNLSTKFKDSPFYIQDYILKIGVKS